VAACSIIHSSCAADESVADLDREAPGEAVACGGAEL